MRYSIIGEYDLGGYYFNESEIRLNLKQISDCCNDYNTDFYTLLLHVINHEFLHHVLFVEHGVETTKNLDNLTHYNQTDDNIWEYWLA